MSKPSAQNPLPILGAVGFFVIMGFYVVTANKINTSKFTTSTSAAPEQNKGILFLNYNDTALLQCLGSAFKISDGLLSNKAYTGTKLTCTSPLANPAPTIIPTPSPAFAGGYYIYDRYAPSTQTIQFTCAPAPPGKAPLKVVKTQWGKTGILLKCQ